MTLMTDKYLETRCEAAVEYLTLNRPDVRNAFNAEMIAEITTWAKSVAARAAGLRAVVIAGAGKTFCAGGDAAWMARTIAYTGAENLQDAQALSGMFRAIDELPLPVIGRIQGAAMGGGAGLAAVCDIVVAAQDATFAFSEVKLGLIPAVVSSFVLHKIGRSAARELFLTGARVRNRAGPRGRAGRQSRRRRRTISRGTGDGRPGGDRRRQASHRRGRRSRPPRRSRADGERDRHATDIS